jgi:hypothetical protein
MTRRASYRAGSVSFPALTGPVNFPTRIVTANDAWAPLTDYSIVVGTLAGSITLTLPAAPAVGDQYEIRLVGPLNLSTVTVSGNGHNVETSVLGTFASTVTFSVLGGSVRYRYDGTHWYAA